MSTTNPGDAAGGLPPADPGQPKADDHDVTIPPDPAIVARGHEADGYDSKSVLSVPLLVVLFFVVAFGVTTVLFAYLSPTREDPRANPQAVERNTVPLDERLGRISRGKEVDQPRLEPLRERGGNSRATTSFEKPGVNSPELHPEDLVPSPVHTPALFRTGWVDPNKTIARVTIAEAMKLATTDKALNLLPARHNPVSLVTSEHEPTAANAGRGAGPSVVEQPPAPGPEAKKDDHKEPKKDEGKKEDKK